MILENIKQSYLHIPYTLKHKQAMLELEKKFTGKNSLRIYLHDADKIFLYALCPFLSLHQHKVLHRFFSKHHHYYNIENLSNKVLKEIVLDWESAHYTKEDKPENAVDFCLRMHPECFTYLLPHFRKWNLRNSRI